MELNCRTDQDPPRVIESIEEEEDEEEEEEDVTGRQVVHAYKIS